MRTEIVDKLTATVPTGFTVSTRLPFEQNGEPLYQQNFKTVYVDLPQTDQEPLFLTLNGGNIVNETITVSAYVTTDAKTLPSNYDTLVSAMRAVRVASDLVGYNQKTSLVETEFVDDSLTTRIDYVFVKTLIDH